MLTIDPDILAIRRRRRQEGRCVACGVRSGRAALCDVCRATLAYCAACGATYPRRPGLAVWCTSDYCTPCKVQYQREARGGVTCAEHSARLVARRQALLRQVIRLYRAGATYDAIATALDIPRSTLASVMTFARRRGEWPAGLRRRKGAS